MATTTPDNLWTPDSGDDYALTVDLAATADTVQTALNNRKGFRTGNGAPTGTGYSVGSEYMDEATGFIYWFNGTQWLLNSPGLNLIGSVDFSNSSVNIDSVFNSRFRNYRLIYTVAGNQFRPLIQLRTSGSTASGGSDYKNQYIFNNTDSALSTSYEQVGQWFPTAGNGNRHSGTVDIFNPARVQATDITGQSVTINNSTISALSTNQFGQHILGVSYDGLRFSSNNGTMSGSLKVYGYA